MLAQDSENLLFHKHTSTLCALVVQLLKVHELLHSRASMQGLRVLILACVDSSLWLDSLVSNAAVLEAVFEVLVNECGFEEEVEEEEALQAQEAAWAVLAAVSRCAATADIVMQVSYICRDCFWGLRPKIWAVQGTLQPGLFKALCNLIDDALAFAVAPIMTASSVDSTPVAVFVHWVVQCSFSKHVLYSHDWEVQE